MFDQLFQLNDEVHRIIFGGMIRSIKNYRYLFAAQKPNKKDADTPNFREKLQIANQLKPYVIPFLHQDKRITTALIKSYGYLGLSKVCFFGGPMFLKVGINSLSNLALGDPFLLFFGYGVCYSASVMFQSLRNVEILKVTSIALTETASSAYRHMLSLGPDFFFSGSQRTKLFNLYKAQKAIQQNIRSFTQYFLPFFLDIGICSTLLVHYADTWTMAAFLTCYAVYSTFTIKYSQYRRKDIKKERQSQRKMDFITSQTFSNYYNVKYFKKEQYEIKKYTKSLQNYYEAAKNTQLSLGILNTVQRIIFGAGLTFNLIMSAYYVQKGLMSTGDIVMIQTLMMQFLSPLFFLGSTYRNFVDTFVEVKELYDTMKRPAEVKDGPNELVECQGDIRFENVKFQYIKSADVIEKLTFDIKAGEFLGIVGESGAGKSTVLNLLFRLFDPIEGNIFIDNQNLKDLKLSFRNHITFVSQHPYLFNGTVIQNLQYGHSESTKQQIEYYTKALGIHDVIMQLPKGYDTNVGEKGNIFSGGEKQRISLIRALLKKSPILLLDEPTSSLDGATEQKVMKILNQMKCTKVMITHRQSLLRYTDKVVEVKKI